MKKKIIIPTIAIASVIALSLNMQSCTDSSGKGNVPKNSEPIPVRVVELKKSSGTHVIKASGQLTTDDETILGFKTSGIVSSILVKEGDLVKKGQLLATLDLREINALVAQARHGLKKRNVIFSAFRTCTKTVLPPWNSCKMLKPVWQLRKNNSRLRNSIAVSHPFMLPPMVMFCASLSMLVKLLVLAILFY